MTSTIYEVHKPNGIMGEKMGCDTKQKFRIIIKLGLASAA